MVDLSVCGLITIACVLSLGHFS